MLILVPAVLFLCAYFQTEHTAILTILTVTAALIPFFLRFEKQKPRPRDIMPIVVLSAVAVAGRIVFAPFPNFKPVSAIVILAGVNFGKQSGFLTGALAALASNLFFGQGPWTPWQMYAWGVMGYLAGVLQAHGFFKKEVIVYIFGCIVSLLFGFLLDSWYIIGYIAPVTWQTVLSAYALGLPFSVTHAVATVLFLIPTYRPWSKKLERIKTKFGIEAH